MAEMDCITTATKCCTKCGEEKPATAEYFSRNAGGKDGLRSYCKNCHRKANCRWRTENPDKAREASRRWQVNNPDLARKKDCRWRAENPDRVRAQAQRRAARKRNLPHTLTATEWRTCLEHFHNCCAYCGAQQSLWHVIEQEHVIPVSAGGAYTADNIVPACRSCNASKQDSEVGAWLAARFGKRKGGAILAAIRAYFEGLE